MQHDDHHGVDNNNDDNDNIMMELILNNEDWCATSAIYADANNLSIKKLPPLEGGIGGGAGAGGGFCGSLEIPISVSNVAYCRRISPDDELDFPRFRFWILNDSKENNNNNNNALSTASTCIDDSPILSVGFYYTRADDDSIPKSVKVSFVRYPKTWPTCEERPYVDWLTSEAERVLREDQQSFAVCDYLEHQGSGFFKTVHRDENLAYSMIVLPPVKEHAKSEITVGEYVNPRAAEFYNPKPSPKRGTNKDTYCPATAEPVTTTTIEEYAHQTLTDRWRDLIDTQCPICFDEFMLGDGVEITCGHYFCRDCIMTYSQYIVADGLSSQSNANPFTCPITSCKKPMLIIGCVKKLLHKEQMDQVRAWYKDIKQPPCWSLDRCLSKTCNSHQRGGSSTMRYVNNNSSNDIFRLSIHVFCDVCGVTWCENCLQRVKGGDHESTCDPAIVIQFCQRYLAASEVIKKKCEDRYPWIKMYAKTKVQDQYSFVKWLSENGQTCPRCKTGVERIEGCFHMTCSVCGTHFCYECGTKLRYPFYGTHHCWEERGDVFLDNVG